MAEYKMKYHENGLPKNWDGKDWDTYKRAMTNFFAEQDLLDTVEKKDQDAKKENKVRMYIDMSVPPSVAAQLREANTGSDMWETLCEVYETKKDAVLLLSVGNRRCLADNAHSNPSAAMTLNCAIVGDGGSVFAVDMPLEGDVRHMKRRIKRERPGRIDCDADELELYVARKSDGTWMTDADAKSVTDTSTLTHLARAHDYGIYDLDSEEEASDDSDSEDAAAAAAAAAAVAKAAVTVQLLVVVPNAWTKPVHRCVFSIAHLTRQHHELLVKKLRLGLRFVGVAEPLATSLAPYRWPQGEHDAAAQHVAWLAYLREHFALDAQELQWLEVSADETLLSVNDEALPFGLRGTASLLLVDRRSLVHDEPLAGVRLVVQVRPRVERDHRSQALAQLIAANLKAPLDCAPMSLVTDLNDRWFFSWFSATRVVTHVSLEHPGNALAFVAAATASASGSSSFCVSFIEQPLSKCRADDSLAAAPECERTDCGHACCCCPSVVT
ncbi:hypothetical protein ATCC90586_002092 [Pythium insidiosum]|nr:hypothetical protein ATCC90586_002092 [Pythium insidiosum]